MTVRLLLLFVLVVAAGCIEKQSPDIDQNRTEDSSTAKRNASVAARTGSVADAGDADRLPRSSAGCGATTISPGVHSLSLDQGGWERTYLLSVPNSNTNEANPRPLLIAMHGYGGRGAGMRRMFERDDRFADEYVMLYPDGAGNANTARGWNSGHPECCGPALANNVNDVAFIREMVSQTAQQTCIDLNRVYATGFSNGGDMAQRLACDAADLMAAVTSVAGRFDYHSTACPGTRPVPAVLYRGLRDLTVPYKKSLLGLAAIKTVPAMEGFEKIGRNHNCRGEPDITLSNGDTICLTKSACDAGFEVTLCTSASATHCWPGIANCAVDGSASFSASDHMLSFFARH